MSPPHYQHRPLPAAAAAVGSSFRGIAPESSNGPFGARGGGGPYSVANGSTSGHREPLTPSAMPPPPPPPQRYTVTATAARVTGDAPHRLEKMVEECDSIPYADEEGSRDAVQYFSGISCFFKGVALKLCL